MEHPQRAWEISAKLTGRPRSPPPNTRKIFRGRKPTFRPPLRVEDPHPTWQPPSLKSYNHCALFSVCTKAPRQVRDQKMNANFSSGQSSSRTLRVLDACTKDPFSCGHGDGEKLFSPWASGRKGQECLQENRTKNFFAFMSFFFSEFLRVKIHSKIREEHSMDQYRSRPKLSENFEGHWSIPFPGEIHVDQSLVHTFSWGNSYGPMALKVL